MTIRTTMTTSSAVRTGTTTKQKVGLVICALYNLTNIPSVLFPSQDSGQDGPPFAILVICSILGVVGLVAAIMAWRDNTLALRVAAGATIVITLTSLPAFFVDVPMVVKALVGASVLITVLAVALMFSGGRRSVTVTD